MISLENIERSYKTGAGQTWVLRRINLKIEAGEFITIMGPSGAGKSSLLNVLALLDDQWAGAYWFHGEAVQSMNRKQRSDLARRNIGMVFQSYHLLDDLTSPKTSIFRSPTKTSPAPSANRWSRTRSIASASWARKISIPTSFPAVSSNWWALPAR